MRISSHLPSVTKKYYHGTVLSRGVARGAGATGAFAPPFFSERQEFYQYLNELLPQIVDLVVLTLGKDRTKAGNKAVLIADPGRTRRYSPVWVSWHECGLLIVGVVSGRKIFQALRAPYFIHLPPFSKFLPTPLLSISVLHLAIINFFLRYSGMHTHTHYENQAHSYVQNPRHCHKTY